MRSSVFVLVTDLAFKLQFSLLYDRRYDYFEGEFDSQRTMNAARHINIISHRHDILKQRTRSKQQNIQIKVTQLNTGNMLHSANLSTRSAI
jgi:hypothetical protein